MISQHTPAADTAAVVTLAADAAYRNRIKRISWSYSAAPTGGALTVVYGSTTLTWHIAAAGPGQIELDLIGAQNQAIVCTIAAGGGAITGTCIVEWELVK